MEIYNLRYLKPNALIFICVVLGISLMTANSYINAHWGVSISVFAVIGGLLGIINSFLWNIRPFSWLYNVPDFSGRYDGTLSYVLKDENCNEVSGTLEHIKIISQNGSGIVVKSCTKQSDGTMSSISTSIEASIIKEKDGTFSLIYNYLNDGNSKLGFPPHYGTEVLRLIDDDVGKHLIGRYYTERLPFQTKGMVDLKQTSKKVNHIK